MPETTGGKFAKSNQAALVIFPDLMHRVQTFMRPLLPFGSFTLTDCRLGLNLLRVLLFA
jgi:hypothetical protein